MKYPLLRLMLVLPLFTQCGRGKQEKMHEEKAIVEALSLVVDGGRRYAQQMTYMHRQEAHDIVPDSSFMWSVMIECGDSISEAGKPLRYQVEKGIARLRQLRETDTTIAPLKHTIAQLQDLLSYLDTMDAYMDTSMTWLEHNAIHWPKPALRKSAISLAVTIDSFNKKWDIHKVDDGSIPILYCEFSKRIY